MEYAVRIIPPDQETLVSITQMLELGEDETRNSDYVCPDEACRVTLFPAVPEKEKPGRFKAPRPYFRCGKSNPHHPSCIGDAGGQVGAHKPPSDKGKIVKPTSDAVMSDHPVYFAEERPSVEGRGGSGVGRGVTTVRGGRGGGEAGGRQRTSERSTRQVSELVRVYEAASPAERARMPLRIRGCPANDFEGAFRPVSRAVDQQGRPYRRHIYYGRYDWHKEYNSGAISIFLAARASYGKPLSVWVEAGLGPATLRQALRERLGQAWGGAKAVVYVLGAFHLHQDYKYTIEIPGLNYLYVSLRSSQQP